MKVVGFNFREQDEQLLRKLSEQLGWNRSQVIRELLSRAVVEVHPRVSVVLPAAAEREEANVG